MEEEEVFKSNLYENMFKNIKTKKIQAGKHCDE